MFTYGITVEMHKALVARATPRRVSVSTVLRVRQVPRLGVPCFTCKQETSVQSMSSSLKNLSSVISVHVSTAKLLGYAVLTETCTFVFSSRPGDQTTTYRFNKPNINFAIPRIRCVSLSKNKPAV